MLKSESLRKVGELTPYDAKTWRTKENTGLLKCFTKVMRKIVVSSFPCLKTKQ